MLAGVRPLLVNLKTAEPPALRGALFRASTADSVPLLGLRSSCASLPGRRVAGGWGDGGWQHYSVSQRSEQSLRDVGRRSPALPLDTPVAGFWPHHWLAVCRWVCAGPCCALVSRRGSRCWPQGGTLRGTLHVVSTELHCPVFSFHCLWARVEPSARASLECLRVTWPRLLCAEGSSGRRLSRHNPSARLGGFHPVGSHGQQTAMPCMEN